MRQGSCLGVHVCPHGMSCMSYAGGIWSHGEQGLIVVCWAFHYFCSSTVLRLLSAPSHCRPEAGFNSAWLECKTATLVSWITMGYNKKHGLHFCIWKKEKNIFPLQSVISFSKIIQHSTPGCFFRSLDTPLPFGSTGWLCVPTVVSNHCPGLTRFFSWSLP